MQHFTIGIHLITAPCVAAEFAFTCRMCSCLVISRLDCYVLHFHLLLFVLSFSRALSASLIIEFCIVCCKDCGSFACSYMLVLLNEVICHTWLAFTTDIDDHIQADKSYRGGN